MFPQADTKVSGEGWSDCARKGLAVKAKRGDALMFYSLRPDGSTDPTSLHGSCATTKGDKWSATKVRAGSGSKSFTGMGMGAATWVAFHADCWALATGLASQLTPLCFLQSRNLLSGVAV